MGTDPIFLRAARSNGKWGLSPFFIDSFRADGVDLVGVEGEPLLDHAHLVVRLLVAPDRVFRPIHQRKIRGIALERAVRPMARAHEPLHLHVLAGEIEDRGIVALLHPDGVARVGDDFAVERHAHALLRGLRLDAMLRVLLVAGSGITSRRFRGHFFFFLAAFLAGLRAAAGAAFHSPFMRPSGSVNSDSLPMPGTSCSSTWITPT